MVGGWWKRNSDDDIYGAMTTFTERSRRPLWLVGGGSEIAITTFTERIRHLRSVTGCPLWLVGSGSEIAITTFAERKRMPFTVGGRWKRNSDYDVYGA